MADEGQSNQVLLKMIIRGMDPAEVRRLADQTYGQLKTEAARHLDELSRLHTEASQKQTEEKKKQIDAEIKAEQKALGAVTQLMRQQEIEANKAHNAWRRTMEDLENITTVARGVFDIVQGGWGRFKQLADEVSKTMNVYGSLKGSIEEMREASNGEISDMDLILTKNKAMQKELALTDAQFGMVAASADAFADSLGTDTKGALDSIIDGLATGRTKMLESAGVIIDTDKAYVAYSEKIGVAVNRLTDHEKKLAVVEASLKSMDKKLAESGGEIANFASSWDKSLAQISNLTDKVFLFIGDRIQDIIIGFSIGLPNAIKISLAKMKDMIPGVNEHYEDQARAALGAEMDAYETGASNKRASSAQKRLDTPGAYDQKRDAKAENELRKKQFAPQYAAEAKAAATEAQKHIDADRKFWNKAKPGQEEFVNEAQAFPNLTEMGFEPDSGARGTDAEASNVRFLSSHPDYAGFRSQNPSVAPQGTDLGSQPDYSIDESAMKLLTAAGGGDKTNQGDAAAFLERFQVEFVDPLKEKVAATDAELRETSEKAGGGIASLILFGVDGPDMAYEQMDNFQKSIVDMSGMVSNAAKQMTAALGKSLAATIAGEKGASASLKKITHDMLLSLSEQAATQMLFKIALGIGDLASQNYPGAALNFASAAAFGALAVGTGLGARATGGGSSAAAPGVASGGMSSASPSQFGSGGVKDSANDNAEKQPVTINMTVMPGGEAEAGRSIIRALDAAEAKEGPRYAKAG